MLCILIDLPSLRQIAFENGSFENVRDLVLDGKLNIILIKLDLPSLF